MTEKKKKPDCYKCVHRGTIPGDAHSQCNHPEVEAVSTERNPLMRMAHAMSGAYNPIAKKLNIVANFHGIRSGWFMWPVNFDPVWLKNCDGFTPKEKPDANVREEADDEMRPRG